jgi:hypothetical protein
MEKVPSKIKRSGLFLFVFLEKSLYEVNKSIGGHSPTQSCVYMKGKFVLGSSGRFEKKFVFSTCFLCLKND